MSSSAKTDNPLSSAKMAGFDFQGTSIKVIVGTEPNTAVFFAHESILTKGSAYFRTAMNGNWNTATSRQVELKECTASQFNFYLNWVYHEKLPVEEAKSKSSSDRSYFKLVRAYILGDMLQDTAFKDAVIDCISAKYAAAMKSRYREYEHPSISAVAYIYRNTLSGSPLREMTAAMFANSASIDSLNLLKNLQGNFPEPFVADLIRHLIYRRRAAESWSKVKCTYHAHEKPAECYKATPTSPPAKRRDLCWGL